MTFSTLIIVFPMWMPPWCGCILRQGIEDGWRGVSFVRAYNACGPGEMVRRFALDNERWRATR